jgi:hypothetical protein
LIPGATKAFAIQFPLFLNPEAQKNGGFERRDSKQTQTYPFAQHHQGFLGKDERAYAQSHASSHSKAKNTKTPRVHRDGHMNCFLHVQRAVKSPFACVKKGPDRVSVSLRAIVCHIPFVAKFRKTNCERGVWIS